MNISNGIFKAELPADQYQDVKDAIIEGSNKYSDGENYSVVSDVVLMESGRLYLQGMVVDAICGKKIIEALKEFKERIKQ